MLAAGELERPGDGKAPRRVVFVQCAGSRDKAAPRPTARASAAARRCGRSTAIHRGLTPRSRCSVVYRDMRAPGPDSSTSTSRCREQPAACSPAATVERVERNGGGPHGEGRQQPARRRRSTLDADLVVLAVGMVPNSADGEAIRAAARRQSASSRNESRRRSAEAAEVVVANLAHHEGTEILNLTYRQGPDLPVLAYGFPDSHYICFPYETRRTGIYAAGAVRAPMDAAQAAEDALGRGDEGDAVHLELAARRGGAPPRRRFCRPRLLPPALHAVQALHRGVPVRRPSTRTQGHAAVQPAAAAGAAASAWGPARSASSRSPTTRWTWWPA